MFEEKKEVKDLSLKDDIYVNLAIWDKVNKQYVFSMRACLARSEKNALNKAHKLALLLDDVNNNETEKHILIFNKRDYKGKTKRIIMRLDGIEQVDYI